MLYNCKIEIYDKYKKIRNKKIKFTTHVFLVRFPFFDDLETKTKK